MLVAIIIGSFFFGAGFFAIAFLVLCVLFIMGIVIRAFPDKKKVKPTDTGYSDCE